MFITCVFKFPDLIISTQPWEHTFEVKHKVYIIYIYIYIYILYIYVYIYIYMYKSLYIYLVCYAPKCALKPLKLFKSQSTEGLKETKI